jgi:single-strand DNA-binding protein
MNGINKIFIAGNLARKPVLYKSKNGKPFSFLSVATNRFSLVEGHWNKKTAWHSILVWGKKAEICEKYLEKGVPLAIEGYLETSMDNKTTIVAEDLHFLGLRTMRPMDALNEENGSEPLT